jgi:hypothetical protein
MPSSTDRHLGLNDYQQWKWNEMVIGMEVQPMDIGRHDLSPTISVIFLSVVTNRKVQEDSCTGSLSVPFSLALGRWAPRSQ